MKKNRKQWLAALGLLGILNFGCENLTVNEDTCSEGMLIEYDSLTENGLLVEIISKKDSLGLELGVRYRETDLPYPIKTEKFKNVYIIVNPEILNLGWVSKDTTFFIKEMNLQFKGALPKKVYARKFSFEFRAATSGEYKSINPNFSDGGIQTMEKVYYTHPVGTQYIYITKICSK